MKKIKNVRAVSGLQPLYEIQLDTCDHSIDGDDYTWFDDQSQTIEEARRDALALWGNHVVNVVFAYYI